MTLSFPELNLNFNNSRLLPLNNFTETGPFLHPRGFNPFKSPSAFLYYYYYYYAIVTGEKLLCVTPATVVSFQEYHDNADTIVLLHHGRIGISTYASMMLAVNLIKSRQFMQRGR